SVYVHLNGITHGQIGPVGGSETARAGSAQVEGAVVGGGGDTALLDGAGSRTHEEAAGRGTVFDRLDGTPHDQPAFRLRHGRAGGEGQQNDGQQARRAAAASYHPTILGAGERADRGGAFVRLVGPSHSGSRSGPGLSSYPVRARSGSYPPTGSGEDS